MGYVLGVVAGNWLYDCLFHHTRRVTRYYVTRERDRVLTISHEPLFFYKQDRKAFFQDREAAYAKIAATLSKHKHIETIKTESVWLNYAREGWTVTTRKNTRWHRLVSVYFYWMNVNNWGSCERSKSWWAIGNQTLQVATMTREAFIERFRRKEVG